DYQINIWGQQDRSEWGPVERKIGHGFARRAVDNVGVQYGLEALKAGKISPAQFADLNAKAGGLDIDGHPEPQRGSVPPDAQSTDMAQCGQLYPHYGTTRTAAGAPLVNNILKCQLKPLRRGDYAGITFTDDQFKQLQQAFPTGVCDYAKPGVGQQRATPWMTLEHGPGGEPLGPAPASAPLCASR